MTWHAAGMRKPLEVEIWADVVCPWCYIGKRRFEQALASFPHRDDVRVTLRSFELDPTPREASEGDVAHLLAAKYGMTESEAREAVEGVRRTAQDVDIDMSEGQRYHGNTRDAHRLLHLAAERGLQEQLAEAFYKAHFTEGRSLFDADSLAAIAASVGLDSADVERVLAGTDYDEAVVADEDLAREFGISGVPFFVFDRRLGVSGAQPAALLGDALAQAWDEGLTR